jgi:FkbM family methyltransferase
VEHCLPVWSREILFEEKLVSRLVDLGRRTLSATNKARLKSVLQLDRRESYSQYGEDAVLFAYFWGKESSPHKVGRPKLRHQGFYVDIGAYAPTYISNTYLFYRAGWHGINIDATPGVMDAFHKVRPRDINLELAIGTEKGKLEFFSWGAPCVFNTLSAEIAAQRSDKLGPPQTVRVTSLPLADVLARHMPPTRKIDFLSVDVEGMDLSVLQSNDWQKFRPELVLVESYVYELKALGTDPIHQFALNHNYRLYAWTPPTLIYRDVDASAS